MNIDIICNGDKRRVADGLTVEALVAQLALGAGRYAVELNGEVVHRGDHASTVLKSGDVVNIVTFVGGG